MAEPVTFSSHRLKSALADAIIAALVAFALFCLILGLRTVDSAQGLTLAPRPGLLAAAVGIVFVGRLLLNLFWWNDSWKVPRPAWRPVWPIPTVTRYGSEYGAALLAIAAALFPILAYALRSVGIGERALPKTDFTLCQQFTLIGSGMIWNLYFGILALFLGFFLANAVAVAKASHNAALRKPAEAFVFVFRGSPLFIQLFFAYEFFVLLPRVGIDIPLGFTTLTLQTDWPAGAPSGLVLLFQSWVQDAGGPQGFAATNALAATVP